ncbi:Protein of unknown function [Cotesia congregata]|uniref:Uncharacterized protein n=1 Tax=Cotesia congregata TaxID=51543 RepID=A0A8J2EJ86_COTCN|nr:Protein of unknown function [Cotesia congregata]
MQMNAPFLGISFVELETGNMLEVTPGTASFITKIQNKGKQPAPAAPTEGPTTSVSTNSNANARPAPTAPTSFTASAQPPTIESMFNPENIPLPSGFNPAPPPRRNPLPPTSDPIIPTGGPYFPTNYNPGSPPTGGPYFPTNYNPGSPPTGGPYFPTNYNPGSPPTGGPYFPTNYNPGSPPTGGVSGGVTGGVTGGVSGGVTGGVSGGVYFPTSLRPTVPRDLPTTRSTKSSAGKLVFIDNQGKSTELSPEQIVDIGKYFDQLLKGSN